jgi:hypothetical protein
MEKKFADHLGLENEPEIVKLLEEGGKCIDLMFRNNPLHSKGA